MPFLKMSYIKIKQKDIHKILVIFRLFIYIYNKFILLLKKAVYPYEYMDSWKRFDETALPNKEAFYSELNLEDITDEDYTHAQEVFEEFKLKI